MVLKQAEGSLICRRSHIVVGYRLGICKISQKRRMDRPCLTPFARHYALSASRISIFEKHGEPRLLGMTIQSIYIAFKPSVRPCISIALILYWQLSSLVSSDSSFSMHKLGILLFIAFLQLLAACGAVLPQSSNSQDIDLSSNLTYPPFPPISLNA